MILVLGSTGTTGGEVARQLIQAGHKPRLLLRNPSKAAAYNGKAEIVQGDLAKPLSLDSAMKNVRRCTWFQKLQVVLSSNSTRLMRQSARASYTS